MIVENCKFKIKLEEMCVFTETDTFKSLISLIMGITLCKVAFYFKRDHHYFIYFTLMQLVSFQMGRIKCHGFFKKFQLNHFEKKSNAK